MSEVTVGLVGIAAVLVLFVTGIEIGFAMAIVGFLGFAYLVSFKSALILIGRDFYDVVSSYGYTVFPLFILMGQVAFNSGIAARLYTSAHRFVGHIPGGLAMATVAAATGFKAICGSSTATAATFSSVAIPEMNKYGYDKRLSTGVVATVGTLGVIMPPSVTLILYGVITEQPIGKLFLAGLVPGLMLAFLYIAIIFFWAKINPSIAAPAERSTWRARLSTLPETMWVVAVFMLVVGGIMKGFFTPTEAGSVGTFFVLLLSFIRKGMTFKTYVQSLYESLQTACMIFMLLAGSFILGHFIAVTNIPQITADWVSSLNMNRYLVFFMIFIIYQIGGSFIEDLAFMILATPIFYPTLMKLGFDPLWLGIMIGLTVMIGVVLPPMAIVVFVVKNITKVPLGTIYKGVYPFLGAMVFGGILLVLFPQIVLWLPSMFK
jgi:tripartite ATP-independent transporter DctM subunit